MIAFLFYILKVIVCSAMFAGCYWWALRNRGCYHWNRFHIVASVVLSIIIPLLNISIPAMQKVIPATTSYAAYFVMDQAEAVTTPVQANAPVITWEWMGWISFISIVLFLLLKEILSFVRIMRLKHCSERIRIPETVLYSTGDASAPFTFFRTIFWKKGISVDSGEGRCMLRHELAHVRLGHSWDKALMQLVCCLFWMNPFFILFRRELELVHEFAADSESSAEELSSLILCTLYPNHYHDFISRFFQSPINRRIFMITKNKKSNLNMLRKMSIVPVALVAMYLFACNNAPSSAGKAESQTSEETVTLTGTVMNQNGDPLPGVAVTVKGASTGTVSNMNGNYQITVPDNDAVLQFIFVDYSISEVSVGEQRKIDVILSKDTASETSEETVLFAIVEVKPTFSGKDAETGFREYIKENTLYPVKAQENGITGRVYVDFTINTDGSVSDARLLRGVDPQLDNEALRVISASPKWTPGKQKGKLVKVKYQFPVNFQLNNPSSPSNTSPEKVKAITKDEETMLFANVDEKPTFNGKDAETGFREYLINIVIYPPVAHDNGISGKVYVEFTIDTDGSVNDVKLLRGVDPLLDNEAIRVIKSSPKWTPGKQKGKPVKVKYQFPVNFQLNN